MASHISSSVTKLQASLHFCVTRRSIRETLSMRFSSTLAAVAGFLATTAECAPGTPQNTVTVTKTVEKVEMRTVVKTLTAGATCSVTINTSFSSASPTSALITSSTSSSISASSSSATSYPSTTYATTPAYPFCTSQASFASVDDVHPRLFNYNGTGAKFFAGTNVWWASHILSDSDLDIVFSEIKNTQLQVVRIWGFGSVNTDPGPGTVFFQLLNSTGSYINYAANGLPRLDAVVSYAEKVGIKIVLNFVNNVGGVSTLCDVLA